MLACGRIFGRRMPSRKWEASCATIPITTKGSANPNQVAKMATGPVSSRPREAGVSKRLDPSPVYESQRRMHAGTFTVARQDWLPRSIPISATRVLNAVAQDQVTIKEHADRGTIPV